MGRLEMSNADHAEVRRSAAVAAEVVRVTADLASRAGSLANAPGGYGTDLTTGTDRVRGHVWPQTGAARTAEARTAPLMQIVAGNGPGR